MSMNAVYDANYDPGLHWCFWDGYLRRYVMTAGLVSMTMATRTRTREKSRS